MKKRSIILLSGGKIQISNSTNMILDMQGGFRTEERGGVEMKVCILIWITFLLANSTNLNYFYMILQGKGLMQTFWLLEEVQKVQVSPPKNRAKMNWRRIVVVIKSIRGFLPKKNTVTVQVEVEHKYRHFTLFDL